jgi:adenosine deaminase CECR1
MEAYRHPSDYAFRQSLSPTAAQASKIVSRIRSHEARTVWTREFEDSLSEDDGDIYPGMMFSLAKDRMEKTELWSIMRRMPKGALLHAHFDALCDCEYEISSGLWHVLIGIERSWSESLQCRD